MENKPNYESTNPLYKDHLTQIFFEDMGKFWTESKLVIYKKFPDKLHDFEDIYLETYYKIYKHKEKVDPSKTIINLLLTIYKNTYLNYQKKKFRKAAYFVSLEGYENYFVADILDIDLIKM